MLPYRLNNHLAIAFHSQGERSAVDKKSPTRTPDFSGVLVNDHALTALSPPRGAVRAADERVRRTMFAEASGMKCSEPHSGQHKTTTSESEVCRSALSESRCLWKQRMHHIMLSIVVGSVLEVQRSEP